MSDRSKQNSEKPRKHTLSRSEKIAIPIIILIAIWVAYSFSQPIPGPPQVASSSTQASGQPNVPDFTLPMVSATGLTGQTLTLSSLRGKVVLLEFMEPWCAHCQKMVPVLENLSKQYGSPNVVLLAVSGPWQGATADDAATFIRNYGSSWAYVYDSSGSVFSSYGVNSTPTFFIIGKDGSIAATYNGEQTYDTLASALASASAS